MSNPDDDLFAPINPDTTAAGAVVPEKDMDAQIDALFQMMAGMNTSDEITIRFQRPAGEAQFILRLLAKHLP